MQKLTLTQLYLLKEKYKEHQKASKKFAGSRCWKVHETVELNKVLNNIRANQVNQLELKPIISNVGMSSCNLRKYLAQLIKQLSEYSK